MVKMRLSFFPYIPKIINLREVGSQFLVAEATLEIAGHGKTPSGTVEVEDE